MARVKDKKEHHVTLITQFHADARTMATEAGISECAFSAATAYLCLAEMVVNDHEGCALRLIASFLKNLANGEIENPTN